MLVQFKKSKKSSIVNRLKRKLNRKKEKKRKNRALSMSIFAYMQPHISMALIRIYWTLFPFFLLIYDLYCTKQPIDWPLLDTLFLIYCITRTNKVADNINGWIHSTHTHTVRATERPTFFVVIMKVCSNLTLGMDG